MKALPLSIDLRITSKCNLGCPFCFGPKGTRNELAINEWFEIIDKISNNGVRYLVLTGGEPTLYKDYHKIIEYAKDRNFSIVLTTNGIGLDEKTENSVFESIDWIALPIDGEDYDSYRKMRGISQADYVNIYKLINHIKSDFQKIKIKIGTVVTRMNIKNVAGIFQQIKDYADVWKIYQICPHNNNLALYQSMKVNDSEFDLLYTDIKDKCGIGDVHTKIIPYKNRDINGMHLFCEPDASAMAIVDYQEYRFANFLHDYEGVLMKWSKYIDNEKLINNKSYYLEEGN